MSRFTDSQIEKISETMRAEQGASAEEINSLLARALTVGDLKRALDGVDSSLPVELEVVIQMTEEGNCMTQPGLAIHSYQVTDGDDGFPRFTLVGAAPQTAESYAEAFELDQQQQ